MSPHLWGFPAERMHGRTSRYSKDMSAIQPLLPDDLEPTFRGVMDDRHVPLAFYRWEHPQPRGRIVLAHGYGEHAERYRHTARWLHDLGWSVSAIDQRGFGRSGGIRGDAQGIRNFVEDLQDFLRHERHYDTQKTAPEATFAPPRATHPQILLGHSFGGLVALLTLLWYPDTMEGLVLSAPAIHVRKMPWPLRVLQACLYRIAPHRPLHLPGDKCQVCSDPVLVQRYWADPLCHCYATAAFAQALKEGSKSLMGLGAELERPILLLDAGEDTVVDPSAADDFWATAPEALLERHHLSGFYHEIFHDLRRFEAQEIVVEWLARCFGAPQSAPSMAV